MSALRLLILVLIVPLLIVLGSVPAFAQCNALEIPNNGIDEDCDGLDDLYLSFPPYIYATEGQDLEIYFRNTILSKHPQDYFFSVNSILNGTSTAEKWKAMIGSNAAGEYPLTLQVKNANGQVLASASTIVRVSPDEMPSVATPRRLILFGHSFFDQGYMPKYIYDLTHQAGNPNITFHGKKTSWANNNARHEGYGGMMARWFFRDGASPIKYGNRINMRSYFNDVMCQNCNPDWMVLHLDINDFCGYSALAGNTLQEIRDSITNDWNLHFNRIVDSIRVASPNTKIGICMSPPPNARQSAFDQTYGSNPLLKNRWRWQKIISCLAQKQLERYGNRENENIYLIPGYLDIDDFGEYNPPDARHPDPADNNINTHCGYNELAKMIYAWIRWMEHHPDGNSAPLLTFYRDADADGYGRGDNMLQAAIQPGGYVVIAGDCDDNNPNINPGVAENCTNALDDNCNNTVDEDAVKPLALCKPTLTVQLNTSGQANIQVADINNGSYDACGSVSYILSQSTFSCADRGANVVKLKIKDATGNENECQTTVNVQDVEMVANCKPSLHLALPTNGQVFLTTDQLDAGSTGGNCGNITMSLSESAFSCENIGLNIVKLKLTDTAGNQKECETQVFVDDVAPPFALCQPELTLELDANGHANIYQWQVNAGSWDACGEVTYQLDRTSFDCGQPVNTVNMTVTDLSGNQSQCQTQLSIESTIAPTVVLLAVSATTVLNGEGNSTVSISDLASVSDDCGLPFWEYSFDNQSFTQSNDMLFSCEQSNGLQTPVWIRARDLAGNVSEVKEIDLWVKDLESPQPICRDLIVYLDHAQPTVTVTRGDISNEIVDNCANTNWLPFENKYFTCQDAGFVGTVTVQAMDASGNLGACTAQLSVAAPADTDSDGTDDCADACPLHPESTSLTAFYYDQDADGFGAGEAFLACQAAQGWTTNHDDCDDNNNNIYPNAPEEWNGLDDNCDNFIDEGFVSVQDAGANNHIALSPNPVSKLLNVEWNGDGTAIPAMAWILEPTGRVVRILYANDFSFGRTLVDVENYTSGNYFFKIKFQNGQQLVKRFQKI